MFKTVENGRHPAEILRGQQVFRNTFRALGHPLLFREKTTHADPEGLMRAEQLHGEGYGIVNLITHPTRREPHQAMASTTKLDGFKNQRISGPLAAHQTMLGIVPVISRACGAYLHKVVTQRTIDLGKASGHPLGFGSIEYMRDAARTLADGGIVIMAPQATRKPVLEYAGEDSVDKLLRISGKRNNKIAIHLIAFTNKGFLGRSNVKDYSRGKGLNIGRVYEAIHGPTFTLEEVRNLSGGFGNIDEWVFSELAKIVPESYLPKKAAE